MKKLLALIIFLHTIILYNLIFFPYPEFFIYPYLTNNGLIPYKQIFDQHFPGLMFLPINFNNLGMLTPEIARIWAVGIVTIIHILLFFITNKILKNPFKALFANLFFLIWQPFLEGWVLWIDSFLPLFLLPAFYFIYSYTKKPKNSSLIWLGIFFGIAIVFKQVVIPLAGLIFIYIFFYTKKIKPLLLYLTGLIPLPMLMLTYFYYRGALTDLWFWTIWFNLTTFAKYGRKAATIPGLIRVGFIFSPMLLIKSLKESQLIILLLLFITGALASASSRFDFVHFQPALPFLAITSALLISKLYHQKYFKISLAVFAIGTIVLLKIFYQGHISNKVLFFDKETYQMSEKIKSLTHDKEEIFILGPSPHLYSMSNTLPAGKVFVFQFPWFLMESEDIFLNALMETKPNLILRDPTVEIEGWKITDYAKKLDNYILQNYNEIDRMENVQFLLKKKDYANRL